MSGVKEREGDGKENFFDATAPHHHLPSIKERSRLQGGENPNNKLR